MYLVSVGAGKRAVGWNDQHWGVVGAPARQPPPPVCVILGCFAVPFSVVLLVAAGRSWLFYFLTLAPFCFPNQELLGSGPERTFPCPFWALPCLQRFPFFEARFHSSSRTDCLHFIGRMEISCEGERPDSYPWPGSVDLTCFLWFPI